MGRRRATAITENPNARLVCVSDSDEVLGKKLAADLHTEFYLENELALTRPDVDVVVISTPNSYHSPMAIEAMKSGKHVFCEKPMATTADAAREMVRVSKKTGTLLKVSSNIRYFGNVKKARELVLSEHIGDVLFMRSWIGHEGWNLKPGTWFVDPATIGGGTLIDNGCHLIDIVRWYFGDVVECIGYTSNLYRNLPGLEDNAVAVLITRGGKPAVIQSSWTEWNGYLYIEIYGAKGSVTIDSRGDAAKTIVRMTGHDEVYDYAREPRDSFKREIDDFITCVGRGENLPPTGYDGMRVAEIIDGIYKSAKEGRKVSVVTEV
jgi:predicted dehydrogenase